jgi:demethylmenaquinone methyltransferase / 2-methoxy-6-polyprenyl-1,4-benzoquinol methylase
LNKTEHDKHCDETQQARQAVALRGDKKTRFVTTMFDSIADRYDLMNALLSFGMTSLWRRRAMKRLPLASGCKVLDVGCGTGWAPRALHRRQEGLTIEALDVSPNMLQIARERDENTSYFEGDVANIEREDETYDLVTTIYTLRNFPDRERSLAQMLRVLKRGGWLLILDAFPPRNRVIAWVLGIWMAKIVPAIASLFTRAAPYRYLAESIERQVPYPEVCAQLEALGVKVISVRSHGLGAAATIVAEKV